MHGRSCRKRKLVESVNSLSNAFAMANRMCFAAQIGMNLLSGGNPLQSGGRADDNARYFEQLFQALKSMLNTWRNNSMLSTNAWMLFQLS